ncbi:MAG: hypothetical protein MASP_01493 [Candidatus Methanolliviera sp. GoM_asphalt]|nr:MAG: hypothetical protein MASP_01493 [Candidatus Methanolliviera sp. GoM_asphalt]
MHLTREEEGIYNGELGWGKKKAMEILVTIGEIFGAEKLIEIKNAHVSGVSYKTIGDAGLEFIENLSSRVSIETTLNPIGLDRERWREMKIDPLFAEKQFQVLSAYKKLGIKDVCTCTPYYLEDVKIKEGENLAWAESSAIIYANSVLGAKTNRESGISALASAIIGKTPEYGYHLEENRIPEILIDLPEEIEDSDYGVLGYILGEEIKDKVPSFRFLKSPSKEELKYLGAGLASSGSVALFHFHVASNRRFETRKSKIRRRENVPFSHASSGAEELKIEEKIEITKKEIEGVYKEREYLTPDMVVFGCPHCSVGELKKIYRLLKGKRTKKDIWICTSRYVHEKYKEIVEGIEKSGAKVLCDTCPVVSPSLKNHDCVMVNSGKAYNYLPSMNNVHAKIGRTEECIREAIS